MLEVDMGAWFKYLQFQPHIGQNEGIFQPQARFKVCICGRRWGKSLGAARWAEQFILKPDTIGWVVSKTYDLTRKVIREIYKDVVQKYMREQSLGKLLVDQQSGPIKLEFPWRAVVEGKAAEHPQSLLGEGLDWLIIDEAASCKLSMWENFLRPTLTDREGVALFITTPNGYNWMYDIYQRGLDPEFPDWSSYKAPSWQNPYLPTDDMEDAQKTLSDSAFSQEYGGEFTTMAGQVYKEWDEFYHVIPEEKLEIDPSWPRYRSIDYGYENPFACLWITTDPEDRVIIYDEYYMRHRTVERHAAYLNEYVPPFDRGSSELQSGTEYEYTVCDVSAAGPKATLREHGIDTVGKQSSILDGLELVRRQLKFREDGTPGLYVSSRCVNMIKEFNLYAYSETRVSEEPAKVFDHLCDCLRYWIVKWKQGVLKQYAGRYA